MMMSYSATRARVASPSGPSATAAAGRPTSARLASTAVKGAGTGSKGTTSMLLANLNAELGPRMKGPTAGVGAASQAAMRSGSSIDRPQSARLTSSQSSLAQQAGATRVPTSGPQYTSSSRPMSSATTDRTSMAALRREYLGATALMNSLSGKENAPHTGLKGQEQNVSPAAVVPPQTRPAVMAFIQSTLASPGQPQMASEVAPGRVLVPSKPTSARPTAPSTASSVPQRRPSATYVADPSCDVQEDVSSVPVVAVDKPTVSLSPKPIPTPTSVAASELHAKGSAVTTTSRATIPTPAVTSTTAPAKKVNAPPTVVSPSQVSAPSQSLASSADASHLNLGLTSMERRHSGKYVRHFPAIEGHYCCGKCRVPLLSGKHKIQSIGGYATFSEYFQHSVDLEVVVPLLSDTFEGSFVALKCVKCRSFFGRLADADGVAMAESTDSDEEDDREGEADPVQVNSCAIVYVPSPPPPGYESSGSSGPSTGTSSKAQGVLALRRMAHNPSASVAARPLSSGSDSDGDTEGEDNNDDDLWASMRGAAKGRR